MKASFIIPTRNRAAVLAQTLPIFLNQRQDSGDYEVVVIDDASTDDTWTMLQQISSVRLVKERLDKQLAAGAARNRGIRLARGEILVFVDDDCFVNNDFLATHLKAHENNSNVVATGPIIDVVAPPTGQRRPKSRTEGVHSNPFPSGNVSVRRKLVTDAGLFDEDFTEYGWEDLEFWERLRRQNSRREYLDDAPVFHFKPPAVTDNLPARLRQERSRGRMGAIYHSKQPRFAVAVQTKQLALLRWLDRMLDPVLKLEKTVDAVIGGDTPPRSRFYRLLLLNHAEISAGMAKRNELRAASGEKSD